MTTHRDPTADPGIYLIPADRLAPGLAERVDSPPATPATPRPAATVVLLRDAPGGPEALLIRRHGQSGFAAGAWVFPGGVVDAEDGTPERAAIREAEEETGLVVQPPLLRIARWITPEPEPRRYDAEFFLARAPTDAVVRLQEAEATDALWIAPGAAVTRWQQGALPMLPPTVHTLRRIAGWGSVDQTWAALGDAPVPVILPQMRRHPGGVAVEIPGDG